MNDDSILNSPYPIDEPVGNVTIVEDFLPLPEHLVPRPRKISIVLKLAESSLEVLKRYADQHHISCEVVIGNLVENYADKLSLDQKLT